MRSSGASHRLWVSLAVTALTFSSEILASDLRYVNGWALLTDVDPFDGKTVTVQSPDKHLFFKHYRKNNRTIIWFSLSSELQCPFLAEPIDGLKQQALAIVRWKIDDGPMHTQRFNLQTARDLSYRLPLHSTEPSSAIHNYRTFGDSTPAMRHDFPKLSKQHKIEPMELLRMLSAGRQLLLRANDQCDTSDIQIDLAGMTAVLTEAGLRQGWPNVDELSPEKRKRVSQYCPKSLSPTDRRSCVEKTIGAPSSSSGEFSEPIDAENAPKTYPNIGAPPERANHSPWKEALPPLPAKPLSGTLQPQDLYRLLSQSVYLVIASTAKDLSEKVVQGSAVAVSKDYAITNCHVVQGSKLIALYDDHSKQIFPAGVSHADPQSDRCFLKVSGQLNPISTVRAIRSVAIGERVYTIGNPSGLSKTLGEGIVSGLRELDVVLVQTTAQISRGSSGGALFDAYGALVGVTTFQLRDADGLNFAIAAEEYWRQ